VEKKKVIEKLEGQNRNGVFLRVFVCKTEDCQKTQSTNKTQIPKVHAILLVFFLKLLTVNQDIDQTGKSYYRKKGLFYLQSNGNFDARVTGDSID